MSNVRLNRGVSLSFLAIAFGSLFLLASCGPSTGVGASSSSSGGGSGSSGGGGGSGGSGGGGGGSYYPAPTIYTAEFSPPVETEVSFPTALASGDFDGDGERDVLVLSDSADVVNVLLGNGDGTFTAAADVVLASGTASALLAGDWNGDGDTDFVVVNGTNLFVALCDGDGTFSATTVASGMTAIHGLASGDVNVDGYADLVAFDSTSTAGEISIFLNNGSGAFNVTPETRDLGTTEPTGLVLADLDGDADEDIVFIAEGDALFGFYENTEDEDDLVATVFSFTSLDGDPLGVLAGDFDSDGDVDLLFQMVDQHYVAWNNGSASFDVEEAGPATANAYVGFGVVSTSTLVFLEQDSSSGDELVHLVAYDADEEEFESTSTSYSLVGDATLNRNRFLLDDLYGEGLEALLLTDGNFLVVLPSVESPVHRGGSAGFDGGSPLTLVATGNGDGLVGLVLDDVFHVYAAAEEGLAHMELDEDGNVFSQSAAESLGSAPATHLASADIDGDGEMEIGIVTNSTDRLYLVRPQSDGSLVADSTLVTDSGPLRVVFGDVDGNDDLEVATVNAASVSIFTDHAGSSTDVAVVDPLDARFGDVDGDGNNDLVVAKDNDTIVAFLGDGSALAGSASAVVSTSTGLLGLVAVGDLDADGEENPDLIAFNATKILMFRHDGSDWGDEQTITVSASETIVQVVLADVTGEGNDDLVVASVDGDDNGKVRIYLGDGHMNFTLSATHKTVNGLLGLSVVSRSDLGKPGIAIYTVSSVYWIDNTGITYVP